MVSERVFVGRARELGHARAAVDAAAAGRGGLACFAGEAGIGKTRLATRVVELAEQCGFRVAWGRCWEAGGAPAYWPWTQIFEQLAIADPFAGGNTGATDARELRFRTFDAASRALAATALDTPVVLALDDLHAADLPSLELLRVVARMLSRTRLLVVCTYREVEARLAGDVGALLAKIGREGDVFALDRLARDEVIAWIRQAAPAMTDDDAARVCAAAEGNPLFVHELLRTRRIDARRLPDGLHAVIAEHVGRLPADVRDLLTTASVLGREIAISDVAALAGRDADCVGAALLAATDAGLLEPLPGRADAFAFSHLLVRDRLYASLPASRNASLHAAAGERFTATDPARAAFHLVEGRGAVADPSRIAEVACVAARAALARYAFEDAVRIAMLAREAVPARTLAACELDILAAEGSIRIGDGERGKAMCVAAAAEATALGAPELAAQAALVYALELSTAMIDATMVSLLRDALDGLGESEPKLRARVAARLSAALTPPTPETHREIRGLVQDTLALSRRLGDPATSRYVDYYAITAHYYHFDHDERRQLCEEAAALVQTSADPIAMADVLPRIFQNLRERGLHFRADEAYAQFVANVRELRRPPYAWRLPMLQATRAILDGRLDEAEALGREAVAIAEPNQVFAGMFAWAQHRITLAMLHDDPRRIAPDAEKILGILSRSKRLSPFAVWVRAALGDRDASPISAHRAEVPGAIFGGAAAVLLGDRERAQGLYEVLSGLAKECDVFWGAPAFGTVVGPVARIAGDVAALLGNHDEARAHYDDAIAIGERMAAPVLVALARRGRDAVGVAPPSTGDPTIAVLVQCGEHWTLAYAGRSHVLKARRGLDYLARLLAEPAHETHVLELSGSEVVAEPGHPMLDAKAKAAYRDRIQVLRDLADHAEERGDTVRAERAKQEIDAIAHQLARALGIGGRDRNSTGSSDRARAAVTMAIRRAIDAISELEPALGAHLVVAVKTGAFCSYRPDPRATLAWRITAPRA